MNIDLSIYENMSFKELNQLMIQLTQLQAKKQEEIRLFFADGNLEQIQHYLEDHNYLIPQDFFSYIDLVNFYPNILPLIKLLKQSPQWDCALIYDCHFFKDIVNNLDLLKQYHDEFQDDLKKYAMNDNYRLYADIPLDCIHYLYQKDTIQLGLFYHFNLDLSNSPNLALYMLENDLLDLSEIQLNQYYVQICLQFPEKIHAFKEKYPIVKSLDFLDYCIYSNNYSSSTEAFKKFLICEESVMTTILSTFPLIGSNVHAIVQSLETNPDLQYKISVLVFHIKYNQPELISELKKSLDNCSNNDFKLMFEQAFMKITLEESLEKKAIVIQPKI